MSDITIYHNPRCGTSRNVLVLIKNIGAEPEVIDYLKTPPTREQLVALMARMAIPVRDLIRQKEGLYAELGLDNAAPLPRKMASGSSMNGASALPAVNWPWRAVALQTTRGRSRRGGGPTDFYASKSTSAQ